MNLNEILTPYIVTTVDKKKVLVRQRARVDSLSDHLPIYDLVIFYQTLAKVLAQPNSTQNDTGDFPSSHQHLKDGKVVHYHRFGLLENLGLNVPEGYQDKITIVAKYPYVLDEELEQRNVDGLTLTYFLSKSKEFSMKFPKYMKHTRGGKGKKR